MESTRQLKVARLLQKDLAEYFQQNASKFLGKMISVTVVRISPDFSFAKVFISIFPAQDLKETLKEVRMCSDEIRYEIARKVRHQLRKMPELAFVIDDSLDYVERIDDLLNT